MNIKSSIRTDSFVWSRHTPRVDTRRNTDLNFIQFVTLEPKTLVMHGSNSNSTFIAFTLSDIS